MSSIANTRQYEIWNGDDGRHWAEHDERLATMAAEATTALLAAAAPEPDDQVLDIGCGTGRTTLLAAARAPSGHATGVDLSGPLLDRARELAAAEGRTNVTFEQADAQVHPFPTGRFDLVISQAGVMFFDDPVAAFGNIGRAMVPGGRLVVLCHRAPNESVQRIFAAAAEHLPMPDLSEESPGVVEFTDPARVHAVLTDAGFRPPSFTVVDYPSVLGSDAASAAGFLLEGQLSGWVSGAAPEARNRAIEAVTDVLRPFGTASGVTIPAAGWLVSAIRP